MNKRAFFSVLAVLLLAAGVGCASTDTSITADSGETRPADGVTASTDIQELQATIIVDLLGDTTEYPIAVKVGGTVIDGMVMAAEELSLEYTTVTDPSFGEYVDSIAGTAGDSEGFWALYVNGESSTVGAASYEIQEGDTITWSYEEIRP